MNAIFIDADNLSKPAWVRFGIQEFTRQYGQLNIRKAFGMPQAIQGLRTVLVELEIEPHVCQFSNKNATDNMLIADVYRTIKEYPEISVVALGSGDSDFLRLIEKLKKRSIKTVCISSNNLSNNALLVYDEVILVESALEILPPKTATDIRNNSGTNSCWKHPSELIKSRVFINPPAPSRKQLQLIEIGKRFKDFKDRVEAERRIAEEKKKAYENRKSNEILLHVPLFKENPGLWIKKGIVTDKLLEFGIFSEYKTKATRVKKTVQLFAELVDDFEVNNSHLRWIGQSTGVKFDALEASAESDESVRTVNIDSNLCETIRTRFGLNMPLREAIELALKSTI